MPYTLPYPVPIPSHEPSWNYAEVDDFTYSTWLQLYQHVIEPILTDPNPNHRPCADANGRLMIAAACRRWCQQQGIALDIELITVGDTLYVKSMQARVL